MRLKFTKNATYQLEIIKELKSVNSGFFTGVDIGDFKLVKNLIPIKIDGNNIDELYKKVYNKTKYQFLGCFYINREPIKSNWLLGEYILSIHEDGLELLIYQYNREDKLVFKKII